MASDVDAQLSSFAREVVIASACALCAASCSTTPQRSSAAGATTASGAQPTVTVPSATPAAEPSTAAAEPPPPVPADAELGDGVSVRNFWPGRYASDVHRKVNGTHARNWYRERGRASLVLTFGAHGSVKGCRGSRVRSTNDGPRVHNTFRLREQQGYQGHWGRKDGWVLVDLALDPNGCRAEPGYVNLAPMPWKLRCLAIEPQGHPILSAPALVCQLTNRAALLYDEAWGHRVPGVLPGRWLVLGTGNGLRVTLKRTSLAPRDKPTVKVEVAAELIRDDTWAQE